LKEKDYTPKQMLKYISERGTDRKMTPSEVIEEFNWEELTAELGLYNFGQ